MDLKVEAFSKYEQYKKERIGKPFKPMGDADWFVAGFLAASSTSSNSEYAKCTTEVLKYIRYSKDSKAGRDIAEIIKTTSHNRRTLNKRSKYERRKDQRINQGIIA